MTLIASAIRAAERAPLPDSMTRAGIGWLVARSRQRLAAQPADDPTFAEVMASRPIAEHAQGANARHYGVPAAFFALALGRDVSIPAVSMKTARKISQRPRLARWRRRRGAPTCATATPLGTRLRLGFVLAVHG
jgi:hypothetical protein